MQKIGFPYVVRAWARDYTRWLIDYGMLGSFEEIEELLFKMSYPIENCDHRMPICRATLDTGRAKYRKDIPSTEEAYLWLQEVRSKSRHTGACRIWGSKGSSNPLPAKLKMGMRLVTFDSA